MSSPAPAPNTHHQALVSLAARLQSLAGTENLEGFSLKEMFSDVFRRRKPEEVEDYFLAGTYRTTPPIDQVQCGWPKPWFFLRAIGLLGLLYIGFSYALGQFNNDKLVHLQQAFDRKANVNQGESMPVPTEDDSFLPYKDNRPFWTFLQGLKVGK
jgi:hypothetical protein